MIFESPMGPQLETKSLKMEAWNAHLTWSKAPRSQGGPKSAQGSKIHSKWVPESTIFAIFLDTLFADSMLNFLSWPGRLLFFLVVKGSNNNKRKVRQGKTREDKTRQAQGKTRQKEQKKTS